MYVYSGWFVMNTITRLTRYHSGHADWTGQFHIPSTQMRPRDNNSVNIPFRLTARLFWSAASGGRMSDQARTHRSFNQTRRADLPTGLAGTLSHIGRYRYRPVRALYIARRPPRT